MNLLLVSKVFPGIIKKLWNRTLTTASAKGVFTTKEITIPVPWGEIIAKTWGDEKGKPVLCLHGWQDNAATFDTLIPMLPTSNYYVAIDWPGHGKSSHLPVGMAYHYMDFLTTIRRIVNHLCWTKFSWIGHSFSAGLGALYASIYKSEIDRLVLIDLVKAASTFPDINKIIGPATDYFLANEMKLNAAPPTYTYDEACQRLLKATNSGLISGVTQDAAKILLSRGLRQVSNDKWTFTKDVRLDNKYYVTMTRFTDSEWFDILKNIRCHTMFIKFSDSIWLTEKESCDRILEIYKTNCASFHYLHVPGGHLEHLNEPTKISNQISEFLNGTLKSES